MKWIDENFPAVIILFVTGIFALLSVGIFAEWQREKNMFTQCLRDGRKEYECYALFHPLRIYPSQSFPNYPLGEK